MKLTHQRRHRADPTLRFLWPFNLCSDAELVTVRSLCVEISAPQGRVLAREGDLGREFAILRSGRATALRPGLPDRTLGPSSWFGELSLLDHGPQAATIVVDEPSRVLVFQAREFFTLLDRVPIVARRLLVDLSVQVRISELERVRCACRGASRSVAQTDAKRPLTDRLETGSPGDSR